MSRDHLQLLSKRRLILITAKGAGSLDKAGMSAVCLAAMQAGARRFGIISQAEAERSFAERAMRATPGRAREILARAGRDNLPQPGDEQAE